MSKEDLFEFMIRAVHVFFFVYAILFFIFTLIGVATAIDHPNKCERTKRRVEYFIPAMTIGCYLGEKSK